MTCTCGSGADGCCCGTTAATPEVITNRPALGQVGYRVGRYATFRSSMLAALSGSDAGPLAALRTRDPADFSLALLDSWAVVLDILTFYNERLANDAYLRTAVEQRSVTEIAALIGYQPSPGVAASATLAFTLSTAPGSPSSVLIPAGTRVQSVPGPGQKPQVFETSADLTALAAWNQLPAAATRPWRLSGHEQGTWITGTANHVSVGDALLFVQAQDSTPVPDGAADLHYVTAVTPDPASGNTRIWWDGPLSDSLPVPADASQVCLLAFRAKAALYGAQAPSPRVLSGPYIQYVPGYKSVTLTDGTKIPAVTWDYTNNFNAVNQISLDASYPGLESRAPSAPGKPSGIPPQFAVFTTGSGSWFFQVTGTAETSPDYYAVTAKTTRLTVALGGVLPSAGYQDVSAKGRSDALTAAVESIVGQTPNVTAYLQSHQLTPAELPLDDWGFTLTAPGVPGMLVPVDGSAITVTGGQIISPGQPAGVSGKRIRLRVSSGAGATFIPSGAAGGTQVPDWQVFLLDTVPPTLDAALNITWSVITTSGVAGSLTQFAGNAWPRLLPADKADPVVSEAITVQTATPSGNQTLLTLATPLTRSYDRSTVRVNANAVLATHGETMHEILGSGDGSSAALSFTLKQAPLTYLTASVTSGAQSTLQVWVNNLRWQEAANLLTAGAADRVFTTSVDASGRTLVRFGDGTHGGRPPTGQANIRAVYRKGIGLAGMVSAGQLSQPLDRPQGLSSVANPGPATGAADPATADEIRASAPLPTTTIGRVVSLQDYQDFALGFAGIAKALATWTWTGSVRGVFLSVAGTNGAPLGPADPILQSLVTALRQNGDPHVPLTVAPYQPVLFTFTAAVAVDTTAYDPARVLTQAWQAVSVAFAFGRRSIGQPVAASEIIEVIQGVVGVTAVRLTGLQRSGDPATAGAVLRPSGPKPPAGAELLVLDSAAQGKIGGWS